MPTSPSYSPTDIGVALVTVIFAALDVLTGYGVLPGLTPQLHATLVTSLTVLTVAGLTLYVANRGIKHISLARVEVAQARASVTSPTPSNSIPYSPAPTLPAPFQIPEEPPPTP